MVFLKDLRFWIGTDFAGVKDIKALSLSNKFSLSGILLVGPAHFYSKTMKNKLPYSERAMMASICVIGESALVIGKCLTEIEKAAQAVQKALGTIFGPTKELQQQEKEKTQIQESFNQRKTLISSLQDTTVQNQLAVEQPLQTVPPVLEKLGSKTSLEQITQVCNELQQMLSSNPDISKITEMEQLLIDLEKEASSLSEAESRLAEIRFQRQQVNDKLAQIYKEDPLIDVEKVLKARSPKE